MLYALIFAVVLGSIQFWNERIFFKKEEQKSRWASFIAGASVTYVFLFLLPDLYERFALVERWIFVFILLGFSIVYVLERYFYRHLRGWKRAWREHEIHYLVLFCYHFLIGIFSLFLFNSNLLDGVLFYMPVLFYSAVGRVSFGEVQAHLREQHILRVLLAVAPLLGVAISPFIYTNPIILRSLFAFIIGAFLYLALMDFVPAKDKGRPAFFVIGASAYTVLIMLTWLV